MLGTTQIDQNQSILVSFANVQMESVLDGAANDNLLLELVIAAFFHGAAKKINKQSDISVPESRQCLIALIMSSCDIPESSVIGILDSIEEMARQHGLIDNIIQKGGDVAELWLACETSVDGTLDSLVEQYRGRSMHEFGISSVSTRCEAQQKLMFLSLDESMSRIYRRTRILMSFMVLFTILSSIGIYWYFYIA